MLDRLLQLAKSQSLDRRFLILGVANRAFNIFYT